MFRVILNVCQYAISCHFILNSFVLRHFICVNVLFQFASFKTFLFCVTLLDGFFSF